MTTLRLATWDICIDNDPQDPTVLQDSISARPDLLGPVEYMGKKGQQGWALRRIYIWQSLIHEKPQIICVQAVKQRQVDDIVEMLADSGSEWGWVGVGRENGKKEGEYSAIFYDKSVVDCLHSDTFWLGKEPEDSIIYPGAACKRICTVANLVTKAGTNFTVLNTHLDHVSDEQRRLGASLIAYRASYEASKGNQAVFVTGNLNSQSSGSDSGAYKIITGAISPVELNDDFAIKYADGKKLAGFKLVDLRSKGPRQSVSYNFATVTGWGPPGDTSSWIRTDYIFGGNNNKKYKVHGYEVCSNVTDDGVYSSGHRLVIADLEI